MTPMTRMRMGATLLPIIFLPITLRRLLIACTAPQRLFALRRTSFSERSLRNGVSHYLSKSLIFARILELRVQQLKNMSVPGFPASFFLSS
jgi:hypothetical protein